MAAGANGALPTEQIWMDDRSASSTRGWLRTNWTMAGTRKTASGIGLDELQPSPGIELRLVHAGQPQFHGCTRR